MLDVAQFGPGFFNRRLEAVYSLENVLRSRSDAAAGGKGEGEVACAMAGPFCGVESAVYDLLVKTCGLFHRGDVQGFVQDLSTTLVLSQGGTLVAGDVWSGGVSAFSGGDELSEVMGCG